MRYGRDPVAKHRKRMRGNLICSEGKGIISGRFSNRASLFLRTSGAALAGMIIAANCPQPTILFAFDHQGANRVGIRSLRSEAQIIAHLCD